MLHFYKERNRKKLRTFFGQKLKKKLEENFSGKISNKRSEFWTRLEVASMPDHEHADEHNVRVSDITESGKFPEL